MILDFSRNQKNIYEMEVPQGISVCLKKCVIKTV